MIDSKNHIRKIVLVALVLLGIPLVVFSVHVLRAYQELQKPGFVVLLFHEIIDHDEEWTNKYQHRLGDFKEQLDYLRKEGYTTILPSEIHKISGKGNDEKIVMLTFDDGTPDHYEIVFPMLMQRNMMGVFFVISGNLGKRYGLSAGQLKEMSQNGMEIGSHSLSHPFLDEMAEERVFLELDTSKRVLSDAIGSEVTSFAPPGGWYNDLVVQVAQDVGYTAFFSSEIGVNELEHTAYIFRRIEVLGTISLNEFKKLLTPHEILDYKIKQSIKFFVHQILGSDNYKRLGTIRDIFRKRESIPVKVSVRHSWIKKMPVGCHGFRGKHHNNSVSDIFITS